MALKTAYPELPLVDKSQLTTVSVLDSVHILLDVTGDECLSRAVYAIMIAESAKTDDKKTISSAGHFNYAGIQTDGNRWGYSDPIVGRFWKVDVGGNNREFAAFKDNSGFFDFMSNRIKKKGFDGCDGDKWTTTYINSWWAPEAKASYTKGTEKYNDKLAIYKTAMRKFDDAKKTYEKGKYGLGSNTTTTTSTTGESTPSNINTVAERIPPPPPAPVFDPEKVFTFNVETTDFLVNKEIGTFSVVKFNVEFAFEGDYEEVPLDDEYFETDYTGLETDTLEVQAYESEKIKKETEEHSKQVNGSTYYPPGSTEVISGGSAVIGKHELDLIDFTFYDNNKGALKCCNIDGKPVNVLIADSIIDLKEACKKETGMTLLVTSGFRPAFGGSFNGKSRKGVKISAQSQEQLRAQNCKGGVCYPDTAPAGSSRHGNGIAVDFNIGSRTAKAKKAGFGPLNEKLYQWMIKNSWKYNMIRAVGSEEWHYEYWPEQAKKGPYGKLPGTNANLFYADLGLTNLTI